MRKDDDWEQDLYDDSDEWEEEEEFHLDKRPTKKQKTRRLQLSIAGLTIAIIAVVVAIVAAVLLLTGRNSYSSQMSTANSEWKKGKYEQAITAFENAINKADDAQSKKKALCQLASMYVEYGDENSAIYYFEEAASNGRLAEEELTTLVGLYENKGDVDAIRKLAENYTEKKYDSLFEKHLLNQPIFNYKSGTYNELLTVEISTAANEQIFYTLDDSTATEQSTPYTEPLQIGEGTTVVHAVAVNANGMLSDEIVTTYHVKLDTPPAPVITPETGTYSQGEKITFHNIPTNCKAYYTIDGTVPTTESIEYTGSFDMMLGNYVLMAICVNEYTGQSSPVEARIYELNVSGKVSYAQAPGRVMSRLLELGIVQDADSTILLPAKMTKIGTNDYYIVKRYTQTGAGMKEQGDAYAVEVNSGAVFKAVNNGQDAYNLAGL